MRIKKLCLLILITCLFISGVFMAGCAQAQDEYEVKIQAVPEEGGEIKGEGTYEENKEVTVEAEPAKDYEFVKWKKDEEKLSGETTYKFEAEKNKDLIAEFQPETDWSKTEVKELSKEAFAVYYRNVTSKLLSSNVEEKMDDLNLNYPGIDGRYFSDNESLAEEVSIDITELNKSKDQVVVTAELTYPHIEQDKFETLEQNIREKILAHSKDDVIEPEEIFVSAIKNINFSEKTTEKSLTIEKVNEVNEVNDEEEKEQTYQVVEIDQPEKLFASFDELYRKAIVDQVDEVMIDLREHNEFSLEPQPPGSINHYIMNYQGEEIKTTTPPRTPGYSYFFSDSIEDIKLILAEDIYIPMRKIWDQLVEHTEYNHLIDIRPEDYFSSIKLGDTFQEDKKQISLTRPYVAATMDTVIGYIDTSTKKVNLFSKISSGSVSDFFWSQSGEYISYYFQQAGSGFGFLQIYDIEEDKVIEVSEYEEFKEKFGVEQKEGFIGEFRNISWSEDDKELQFEAECTDEAVCKEEITSSWRFDVEEKELN